MSDPKKYDLKKYWNPNDPGPLRFLPPAIKPPFLIDKKTFDLLHGMPRHSCFLCAHLKEPPVTWPDTPEVKGCLKYVLRNPHDRGAKAILADACQDGGWGDECDGLRAAAVFGFFPFYSNWGSGKNVFYGFGWWGEVAERHVYYSSKQAALNTEVLAAIIPADWWKEIVLQDSLNLYGRLRAFKRGEDALLQLAVAFAKLSPERRAALLQGTYE